MSTSGGPVDRAVLEDLAASSRILADQGVFDAAGHVSMRHPGHPERFLMSRSLAPQMITADDIMEFDIDSNAIDARGRNGFIERYLHGEIFRARPDVMAIAHSHSPSTIAFGLSNVPMRAMYHNAAFLAAGVPVFDIREKFGATDIVISTAEKGAALAKVLADKPVALLRAHGMVATGPSLPVAVFRAIFTVTSASYPASGAGARRAGRGTGRGGGPSRRRGQCADGRPRMGFVEEACDVEGPRLSPGALHRVAVVGAQAALDFRVVAVAARNAWSRSAMMSSMCSMPTDSRTKPGVTPLAS